MKRESSILLAVILISVLTGAFILTMPLYVEHDFKFCLGVAAALIVDLSASWWIIESYSYDKIIQRLPVAVWTCPECQSEQPMYEEVWCGKNLLCQACNTFYYYNEWSVKK